MTATVGIRSGLTRHWTGSLLDLDCNSEATLDDCFEKDTKDTFYVNWHCAATTSLEKLCQNENPHVIRTARDLNACIYEQRTNGHVNGFSKHTCPGESNSFNTNHFFRLRQLFYTLRRTFHQNYHKNKVDFWRDSSWDQTNTDLNASTLDDSDLSYSTNQCSMWPSENPFGFAKMNKRINGLIGTNFERFFSNEANFFRIAKAKRRHCNSEGDLRFLNLERCSVEVKERLSKSFSEIPMPKAEPLEEKQDNDADQQQAQLNSTLNSFSCSSVDTLTELLPCENLNTDNESKSTAQMNINSDQQSKTYEKLSFSNTNEINRNILNLVDNLENEDKEEHKKHNCEVTVTLPKAESSPIISVEKCETSDVNNLTSTLLVETKESKDQLICISSSSNSSMSNLSNSSLKNLERENSTASTHSSRLAKTVSFADEVGQSLTEVFLFSKSEDECQIPDYDDEFDGPFLSFVRKPQATTFERFTRSRVKRVPDTFLEIPSNYKQTQTLPPNSLCENRPSSEINDIKKSVWVLGFSQPAAQYYEFRQRVENGCVSLENITLTQPDESQKNKTFNSHPTTPDVQFPYLSGTIKVKNLAFDKNVWLRMTTDQWKTYTDFQAVYNAELSSGSARSPARFDTFTFQIPAASFPRVSSNTDRIEFAIRYCAGLDGCCGQFWDNNDGQNYVIERRRMEYNWSCSLNPATSPAESFNNLFYNLPEYSQPTVSNNTSGCNPYTTDYRPNFAGITSFTDYRAWEHFATESIYY